MNTVRVVWAIVAAALIAAIVAFCLEQGWAAAGVAALFAVLPDVALVGAFAERGRLKPSRVLAYNLLHSLVLAVLVTVLGLTLLGLPGEGASAAQAEGQWGEGLLGAGHWGVAVAGMAWCAHIAADRAFGYGTREKDGTIRLVGVPRTPKTPRTPVPPKPTFR